ncbi:unnamed protein product, partial [Mesorhabditis belari]|uniref:RRM domain-containing protein n=1 Tax=Mesorhabditis belari TaxID=2138241 RepID=A0AAF3ENC4_9BILA
MGDPSTHQDHPDGDTIKMFVGQVPRAWGETECRDLFEKYGPVYTLNVLRDKATQQSKGCCFVTFFHRKDAIGAQAALHNIEVLPGMHHPVQMKPADSENRNERKLFVGMISKKLSEEDVKEMFHQFGHIEECTVLRDNDGRSKGCAFVTLSSRSCAQTAIKAMHHSITMEGCNSPIVCKFADTTREKDGKGKQPQQQPSPHDAVSPATLQHNALFGQLNNAGQAANQLQALQTLAALLQPPQAGAQPNVLSLLGNVLTGLSRLAESGQGAQGPTGSSATVTQQSQSLDPQSAALLGQQLSAVSQMPFGAQQQQPMIPQMAFAQALAVQPPTQPQLAMDGRNMFGYAAFAGAPATQNGSSSSHSKGGQSPSLPPSTHHPLLNNSPFSVSLTGAPQCVYQPITSPDAFYQAALSAAAAEQHAALTQLAAAAPAANPQVVGNGQTKGPDGGNLFIYHLPQDFTDADLVTTFSPFGSIVSAKVFIDKQTNLSKCFGFVSFDNHISAANAISAMNGFQIGSKRLKVQLKSSKSKPYTMGPGGVAV